MKYPFDFFSVFTETTQKRHNGMECLTNQHNFETFLRKTPNIVQSSSPAAVKQYKHSIKIYVIMCNLNDVSVHILFFSTCCVCVCACECGSGNFFFFFVSFIRGVKSISRLWQINKIQTILFARALSLSVCFRLVLTHRIRL